MSIVYVTVVVATMRDLGKRGPLEKAAGNSLNRTLEIKQLDACCEDSIRECVNSLPDRRVDVLGLSPLILKVIFKPSARVCVLLTYYILLLQ